jgi:hypothetical protein
MVPERGALKETSTEDDAVSGCREIWEKYQALFLSLKIKFWMVNPGKSTMFDGCPLLICYSLLLKMAI